MRIDIFSRSRYGDNRYLTQLEFPGCYRIDGRSHYARYSAVSEEDVKGGAPVNSLNMVDFEGGPCLLLGQEVVVPWSGKTVRIVGIKLSSNEADCDIWAAVKIYTKEQDEPSRKTGGEPS